MYGYSSQGKQLCSFKFCLPQLSSALEGKNFERFFCLRKGTGGKKSCLPLNKMTEKHEWYPDTLKVSMMWSNLLHSQNTELIQGQGGILLWPIALLYA